MLQKINKQSVSPSLSCVRNTVLELFAKTFHGNLWSSVFRRHIGVLPRDTNRLVRLSVKSLEK